MVKFGMLAVLSQQSIRPPVSRVKSTAACRDRMLKAKLSPSKIWFHGAQNCGGSPVPRHRKRRDHKPADVVVMKSPVANSCGCCFAVVEYLVQSRR